MFHIIDDQTDIKDVIELLLNDCGHETASFSSPHDYLEYLHSPEFKRPLAVITDINMPEMNGYTLISKVSEVIGNLRYIIISGEPHIRHIHPSPACIYLSKPFNFDMLMESVEKVLACEASSPSCIHECGNTGDRKAFGIFNWRCPQCRSGCGSDCTGE